MMGDVEKEVAIPALNHLETEEQVSANDLVNSRRHAETLADLPDHRDLIEFPREAREHLAILELDDADVHVESGGLETGTQLEPPTTLPSSVSGELRPTLKGAVHVHEEEPGKGTVSDGETKNPPTEQSCCSSPQWQQEAEEAREEAERLKMELLTIQAQAHLNAYWEEKKRFEEALPKSPPKSQSPAPRGAEGRPATPPADGQRGRSRSRSRSRGLKGSNGADKRTFLDTHILNWCKEKHPASAEAFLKSKGVARSCMKVGLMDMYNEAHKPFGDDPAAAQEDREEAKKKEPAPPAPENTPYDVYAHHLMYLDEMTGENGVDPRRRCRYYEIAQPDNHSWFFFYLSLAAFVLMAGLGVLFPGYLFFAALILITATAERLSTIRSDDQYEQSDTPTGRRGVYRELTNTLFFFHLVFAIGMIVSALITIAMAVVAVPLIHFGLWWMLLLELFPISVLTCFVFVGFVRFKDEAISVLRSRLTIYGPEADGVTRRPRLNDPEHTDYIVDNRAESEKGSDLTVATVSIGKAEFRVRVALSLASPPPAWAAYPYDFLRRFILLNRGAGHLTYSMAELEQYLTVANTNILLTPKTMFERMCNYSAAFHRVAYGAVHNIGVQNMRANTAWMAYFIALSQNLILQSVAGNAMPLTVNL